MEKTYNRISIIGSGNVAWHLTQKLERLPEITVLEVYSRKLSNASKLSRTLLCTQATDDLDFRYSKADIFLVAVADDSLGEVLENLQVPPQTVVAHTSGGHSLEIFKDMPQAKGVFYPLQTFSKNEQVNFENITFCLEADSEETLEILKNLAFKLSTHIEFINSEERKILHTAAVFANNFTNHLLALSKEITDFYEVPFDAIKPLMKETFEKAMNYPPKEIQTGPAKRNDLKVIEKHLEVLEKIPQAKEIYKVLTESIRDFYQKENI